MSQFIIFFYFKLKGTSDTFDIEPIRVFAYLQVMWAKFAMEVTCLSLLQRFSRPRIKFYKTFHSGIIKLYEV